MFHVQSQKNLQRQKTSEEKNKQSSTLCVMTILDKKSLQLTSKQRQLLVGLLLGDAHLETQHSCKRTYRLKIEQSERHAAYVRHLFQIWKEWIVYKEARKKYSKLNTFLFSKWAFATVSHSAFRWYAQQFYRNGQKCVPRLISQLLTAQGLAYWYMDDGSMKSSQSKGVIFNTQGYSFEDVLFLTNVLKSKFGLQAKPRCQWDKRTKRHYYQIYISGHSYELLRSLIADYLHEDMKYKFPLERTTRGRLRVLQRGKKEDVNLMPKK